MTHTSPCGYLIWSTITTLLALFLVFHLWSFDRFKCLRWNNGPHNGAFKRIMTYSYIISIPLIFTYVTGNAIIKYREGYIQLPIVGIVPKPYELWRPAERRSIFPLTLMFSIGWSLEMVTHLEELCFWLFLVNSGSSQQNWFGSFYFRTWSVGSVIAVIYMPLVTTFTRHNPLKSEAYTFLAGSLGSLSLTLWFVPILWAFPNFLNSLRGEGVDISTIVRLTKFSELNTIRVVFRFMFTIPLLILGADGVRLHNHVNESMFWIDLMIILSGFGCSVSSALTLVIFFPRSIEGEIATADARRKKRLLRSHGLDTMEVDPASHADTLHYDNYSRPQATSPGGTYLLTSSPIKQGFVSLGPTNDDHRQYSIPLDVPPNWHEEGRNVPQALPVPLRPNRKKDVEMGTIGVLTETNLSMHNLHYRNVNPMVSNFTSPIDISYQAQGLQGLKSGNGSRLTFTRK